MKHPHLPQSLILLALLAGCLPGAPAEPSPTPPIPTAAPVDTPQPTQTAPAMNPACLPDVQALDLPAAPFQDAPAAILEYLNAAGSPVALTGLLSQAGIAAQPVPVAITDATGDGRDDVTVALADLQAPDLAGRLLVYACTSDGYAIALDLTAGAEFTRGFRLWAWQDLDGDKAADLLVSRGLCGAHTCFEDLMVMSWDGAVFSNRLSASTAEIPSPQVAVSDTDGDRRYEIEVTSAGFGSVGAGPQREIAWIYAFEEASGVWSLHEQRAQPSPYRIHVLHDADDAAARAEYEQAVQRYRQVIDDSGLDDWVAVDGGAAVRAYARFQIAAIAVVLQDETAVEAAFAELEASYPAGDPLHAFVEMAILFRNAFASGGLGAACTGAAGFAESHADVILAPLGSQVYGYANRDYTGESLCPAPDVGG